VWCCGGVSGGSCGDGFINIGEECDGVKFGSVDECSDFVDFVSGVLRCSSCRLSTGGCVAGPDCGNGVVDVGESCDGVNFGLLDGSCVGYDSVSFVLVMILFRLRVVIWCVRLLVS